MREPAAPESGSARTMRHSAFKFEPPEGWYRQSGKGPGGRRAFSRLGDAHWDLVGWVAG
jgi:hypothetical protein